MLRFWVINQFFPYQQMSLLMTCWAILTFKWLMWFWNSLLALANQKDVTGMYNLRSFQLDLTIHSTTFTWFWKDSLKLANIHDLQPLSVNWYCNLDRGFAGFSHHLHCNSLSNIPHRILNCCFRTFISLLLVCLYLSNLYL